MDAAHVLQTRRLIHQHLRREALVRTEHPRADDRGVAGSDQASAADYEEDPVASGVTSGLRDSVEFSSLHMSS